MTMTKPAILSMVGWVIVGLATDDRILPAVDGFSSVSTATTTSTTRRSVSLRATNHLVEIRDSNFRDLFRAERPVLVDCCAQWCGPCKLIEPVLDEFAEKWQGAVVVGKYDVESGHDEVKVELLLQGVMPQSLPALILVHKNKVLATHKGIIRAGELDAMLEEHVLNKNNNNELVAAKTVASSKDTPPQKSGLISFATAGGGSDDYMLRQM